MIDRRFQGKGYAKEAMNLIINAIKADKSKHKILLGVDKSGDISVKLYESLGFMFNGQVFGKENIMQLEY
jgi:diamine N-acetyltransferase